MQAQWQFARAAPHTLNLAAYTARLGKAWMRVCGKDDPPSKLRRRDEEGDIHDGVATLEDEDDAEYDEEIVAPADLVPVPVDEDAPPLEPVPSLPNQSALWATLFTRFENIPDLFKKNDLEFMTIFEKVSHSRFIAFCGSHPFFAYRFLGIMPTDAATKQIIATLQRKPTVDVQRMFLRRDFGIAFNENECRVQNPLLKALVAASFKFHFPGIGTAAVDGSAQMTRKMHVAYSALNYATDRDFDANISVAFDGVLAVPRGLANNIVMFIPILSWVFEEPNTYEYARAGVGAGVVSTAPYSYRIHPSLRQRQNYHHPDELNFEGIGPRVKVVGVGYIHFEDTQFGIVLRITSGNYTLGTDTKNLVRIPHDEDVAAMFGAGGERVYSDERVFHYNVDNCFEPRTDAASVCTTIDFLSRSILGQFISVDPQTQALVSRQIFLTINTDEFIKKNPMTSLDYEMTAFVKGPFLKGALMWKMAYRFVLTNSIHDPRLLEIPFTYNSEDWICMATYCKRSSARGEPFEALAFAVLNPRYGSKELWPFLQIDYSKTPMLHIAGISLVNNVPAITNRWMVPCEYEYTHPDGTKVTRRFHLPEADHVSIGQHALVVVSDRGSAHIDVKRNIVTYGEKCRGWPHFPLHPQLRNDLAHIVEREDLHVNLEHYEVPF